ncbi:MAG: ribonuclease Z [Flavobacterium sp.]|uniref:ribonuclease Z n=1 Tax=Flavobacterium sp. TaxID=239 RepID=UPI00326618FC
MKVEEKGHTTIIKDTQGDLTSFLLKLDHETSFSKHNLIIDLSSYKNLVAKDILLFTDFYKMHKKEKKSFVIVASEFDFNANTKNIVVVPSILEAHDIIEMEEIERDLGF